MKHRFLPAAAALALFSALIFGADAAREGARTGLSLSFQMAVPALVPCFGAGALLTACWGGGRFFTYAAPGTEARDG